MDRDFDVQCQRCCMDHGADRLDKSLLAVPNRWLAATTVVARLHDLDDREL